MSEIAEALRALADAVEEAPDIDWKLDLEVWFPTTITRERLAKIAASPHRRQTVPEVDRYIRITVHEPIGGRS